MGPGFTRASQGQRSRAADAQTGPINLAAGGTASGCHWMQRKSPLQPRPIAPSQHAGNDQKHERLLITPREAAKLMSISERTLWTLTHKRDLPYVRIGRSIRYSPSDLVGWIEKNKTVGRASARNIEAAGNLPSNGDYEPNGDE